METKFSIGEIGRRIYKVRGYPVMLDSDLARLYGVETKSLKRAVRRNLQRFPADFMFEPTRDELENLRCQIGTSNVNAVGTSQGHGGERYVPFVFSELGVAMLSSVLRSERAIQINIAIMRIFIQVRKNTKIQGVSSLLEKVQVLEERISRVESVKRDSTESGHIGAMSRILSIQESVSAYFGINLEDLKAKSRTKSIVLPRHIAIYLIRKETEMSFQEIGLHFGVQDHTTIMYAVKKIQRLADSNHQVKTALRLISKS